MGEAGTDLKAGVTPRLCSVHEGSLDKLAVTCMAVRVQGFIRAARCGEHSIRSPQTLGTRHEAVRTELMSRWSIVSGHLSRL